MRFAGRTANGIPKHAYQQAESPVLRFQGEIERSVEVGQEAVRALPHRSYLRDFHQPDTEYMPETDWTGVTLADLLTLVTVNPNANYLRIAGGPYAVAVAMESADSVLLCDQLCGEPLTVEQGGPWRLVVPDRRYFTSVKWVDRIEITEAEPDDSAMRIAQARARARAKQSD